MVGARAVVNVRACLPFSRTREGRELRENNIINIVVGTNEREVPFKYRTNENGVDIIFTKL